MCSSAPSGCQALARYAFAQVVFRFQCGMGTFDGGSGGDGLAVAAKMLLGGALVGTIRSR